MQRDVAVYGIPSCGTVKKARAWLDGRGVSYRFVDLRAEGLDPDRAARWVAALGSGPLRNTSGGAYRALGPEKDGWDAVRWTEAFVADPMLVRRPVIEVDGVPVITGFRDPGALERALA